MKQQPITTKETPSWKNTFRTDLVLAGDFYSTLKMTRYPFFVIAKEVFERDGEWNSRAIGTLEEWGMA